MKKAVREWTAFLLILFGAWTLLALCMDNALVCPAPWQTFEQMLIQVQKPTFFLTIGTTILRAMEALGLSFVFGVLVAFVSAFYSWCSGFFNRLVSLIQTVPNVCYIILLLFWTSREQTVVLTGFFLLFPLIYRTIYEELLGLQKRFEPVWTIYPQPAWVRMVKICLPMLKPAFLSALKSASSLAFKVCVTSEILTGITPGIGRSLQTARLDLNPAGVLGWSIWLILLVFIFEKLWNALISFMFRE